MSALLTKPLKSIIIIYFFLFFVKNSRLPATMYSMGSLLTIYTTFLRLQASIAKDCPERRNLNLNVVVRHSKMTHVKDGQKLPGTLENVHNFVLDNRRVKMCEIDETVGISEERVQNTLNE
ncbi:hypothetical protein LAZ67_7001777 [Cordylochernes scorpioides]|uniref:Uncharacterized protein n=1 Tax=Cordylochernes scorpioides TaxID=51811 RepID=A0ABY6KSL4_9ARAC|nr:hypothetical protein LAZ67_7001777 [Cordylochernes scorpioides]